jgi:hypothetical protein
MGKSKGKMIKSVRKEKEQNNYNHSTTTASI